MSTVDPGMESMLETFIHETDTMLEQLDEILLESERARSLSEENINDIFRITHTIKGSAAMMEFDGISNLSHAIEDVFYVLREAPDKLEIVFDSLFDLILESSDFLKEEIGKLQGEADYQEKYPTILIDKLHDQANFLKGNTDTIVLSETESNVDTEVEDDENTYRIRVFFDDGCQMENMRAFMLLTQLQHYCDLLESIPSHPENDSEYSAQIIKNGFVVICKPTNSLEEVLKTIEGVLNIKTYEVLENSSKKEAIVEEKSKDEKSSVVSVEENEAAAKGTVTGKPVTVKTGGVKQSLISVNQGKLDYLMDLVGELVTAESMVIRNPDLNGLKLDNLTKSIRELRKLTDELQDIVMSIRMVPLQSTFHKMDRIVRDMSKKLGKKAELVTEGGDTEVDKTINDTIVDPLMHMIRNSMDHAIESAEERKAAGKPEVGRISLTAKNVGGEIHIKVGDDGYGMDPQKLLSKAKKNGLLTKPESEYTEKEALHLIMLPGFSTNTEVTEFSGRGVGMDVVRKNIEQVGGSISISSTKGKGTTFTIKIPLTLAIMDGMNISVGDTIFTIPITSIRQSFKVTSPDQIIENTNGTEMIMLRGECYPVFRLHNVFGLETELTDITEGIMIQVESSNISACIFADELLGEYQVVVKSFPMFFNQYNLKEKGFSGCSILGDGSISLILDINNFLANQ
ncbi:chemotaxis protein CheA [Scatolibacter rhodanostii]|uniref:chemotaxis protein CheA n=1 Tax=Scatolibacter rhodanostii TaxID=2014781 RepID=UPI000C08633E|nr:chemotaxis protein CheA [Scatolibacter rhodanostii]